MVSNSNYVTQDQTFEATIQHAKLKMTMGIKLNNRQIAINNQSGQNNNFTPRIENKHGNDEFVITNSRSGHGGVEANGAKYAAKRQGVFS